MGAQKETRNSFKHPLTEENVYNIWSPYAPQAHRETIYYILAARRVYTTQRVVY